MQRNHRSAAQLRAISPLRRGSIISRYPLSISDRIFAPVGLISRNVAATLTAVSVVAFLLALTIIGPTLIPANSGELLATHALTGVTIGVAIWIFTPLVVSGVEGVHLPFRQWWGHIFTNPARLFPWIALTSSYTTLSLGAATALTIPGELNWTTILTACLVLAGFTPIMGVPLLMMNSGTDFFRALQQSCKHALRRPWRTFTVFVIPVAVYSAIAGLAWFFIAPILFLASLSIPLFLVWTVAYIAAAFLVVPFAATPTLTTLDILHTPQLSTTRRKPRG